MNLPSKHVPFDSIYRPDFQVVEERQDRVLLFPHTAQLPLLLRALNLEFYGPLPGHIARVDRRADDFHKHMIRSAALLYGLLFNAARKDGLHLLARTWSRGWCWCSKSPSRIRWAGFTGFGSMGAMDFSRTCICPASGWRLRIMCWSGFPAGCRTRWARTWIFS
jgi:hypothetical protein